MELLLASVTRTASKKGNPITVPGRQLRRRAAYDWPVLRPLAFGKGIVTTARAKPGRSGGLLGLVRDSGAESGMCMEQAMGDVGAQRRFRLLKRYNARPMLDRTC